MPHEHDEVVEIERNDERRWLLVHLILEVDDEAELQQIDVVDDVELVELEEHDYIDIDEEEVDDDIDEHEVEGHDEDEIEVAGVFDEMLQLIDDDEEEVVVIVDDDADVDELLIYATKQIEADDSLLLPDEIVVSLVIDIVCIDLQVTEHLLL